MHEPTLVSAQTSLLFAQHLQNHLSFTFESNATYLFVYTKPQSILLQQYRASIRTPCDKIGSFSCSLRCIELRLDMETFKRTKRNRKP